jgi:hypothetical protein
MLTEPLADAVDQRFAGKRLAQETRAMIFGLPRECRVGGADYDSRSGEASSQPD